MESGNSQFGKIQHKIQIRSAEGCPFPCSLNFNKVSCLIHNDIPLDFREPAKVKRGGDIGFVGVLEKRKGVDILLKSYAKLHNKIKSKLIIVGDGPMKNEIKGFIKERGLESKVELRGWKSHGEVKKLISSFSLLMFTICLL